MISRFTGCLETHQKVKKKKKNKNTPLAAWKL